VSKIENKNVGDEWHLKGTGVEVRLRLGLSLEGKKQQYHV